MKKEKTISRKKELLRLFMVEKPILCEIRKTIRISMF